MLYWFVVLPGYSGVIDQPVRNIKYIILKYFNHLNKLTRKINLV